MRNILSVLILIILLTCCKKTQFSPEGPTDVRIKNLTADKTFIRVIVNTSGGIDTVGNIAAGGFSDYSRFEKAFVKAEISALIDGQLFSTGPVNYNGLTYQGQVKLTYEVFISDINNKKLEIGHCSLDAPLD